MSTASISSPIPPKKQVLARQEIEGNAARDGGTNNKYADHQRGKKLMYDDSCNIIEGKRQRDGKPNTDAICKEWIETHLRSTEATNVRWRDLYAEYVRMCSAILSSAVSDRDFVKHIKEKFSTGYTLQDTSPLLPDIKFFKKKVKNDSGPKAATLKLKMRDIINTVINELGNPRNGVRFFILKKLINSNYPALQIDLKPNLLKQYLKTGVKWGHFDLVKGVGACGYYRIPGEPSEEELEREKKVKESKNVKKKNAKRGDEADEIVQHDEADESTAEDDKETDDDKEPTEKELRKIKYSKTKKKTKRPTNKKLRVSRKTIIHGEPARVEDTFYMAMTMMSEPKVASVGRIKKYIEQHFDESNLEHRLKKTIEKGIEKHYWDQISGKNLLNCRLELNIGSFDPDKDDDLVSMVVKGLMACNEPKQCSGKSLKGYISNYHLARFPIDRRPHMFKSAVERALNKRQIIQLSGIGCAGSFQLAEPFTPSPLIIAGNDSVDDYESDEEKAKQSSKKEFYVDPNDIDSYRDKYVPRPSKRRGLSRGAASSIERFSSANVLIAEPSAKKMKKQVVVNKSEHFSKGKKDLRKRKGFEKKHGLGKKKVLGKKKGSGKKKSRKSSGISRGNDAAAEERYKPRKSKSRS